MESLDVLASRLPEGAVTTERQILRERAIDSWALALLRQVRGEELPVPAAVIFPACTEDVATVLAWAGETGTAVIPRGAGSGVPGVPGPAGRLAVASLRLRSVYGAGGRPAGGRASADRSRRHPGLRRDRRGPELRHARSSRRLRIDVGRLTCTPGVTRYFTNIAEAGLGGTVVARTAGLPGFLGGARYLCGFWLTLPGFRPATVRLEADGQAYQWRAHNVVVANGRFYGGGMQISPASEPDDGALDVLVMAGPKSEAFTIVPRVYRGTHLPHRNIAALRAGRLRVDADPPFDIEADGEVLGTTPATFEIIPGAIRLKI